MKKNTLNKNLIKTILILVIISAVIAVNSFALTDNIVSERSVEAVPIIQVNGNEPIKYEVTDNIINPEIEKKNKENEERYEKEEAARQFRERTIIAGIIIILIVAVIYIVKPIDKEKLGLVKKKIVKRNLSKGGKINNNIPKKGKNQRKK